MVRRGYDQKGYFVWRFDHAVLCLHRFNASLGIAIDDDRFTERSLYCRYRTRGLSLQGCENLRPQLIANRLARSRALAIPSLRVRDRVRSRAHSPRCHIFEIGSLSIRQSLASEALCRQTSSPAGRSRLPYLAALQALGNVVFLEPFHERARAVRRLRTRFFGVRVSGRALNACRSWSNR